MHKLIFSPFGKTFLAALILSILLPACGEEAPLTPKPRGYPKVVYPEKAYQAFDADYCNFTFQYPVYAQIQQDTTFFEERPAHPCWFNVYIPAFDSRLHCTYTPIGKANSFEELKSDAFELMDWHKKRANGIQEIPINLPGNVSGFVFDIEGPAASPFQFYLSDSTNHFFRGALYFNTQARPDSLAPIYTFVKEDLLKMIETFKWTKPPNPQRGN